MTTTQRLLLMLALTLAACGGSTQDPSTRLLQFQVTPPLTSTAAGFRQQLTATARYQDGHSADISGKVTWSSADPTRATVDGSGLVTTAAPGATRVVATLAGELEGADITVTAASLQSLDLITSLVQVPLGAAVTAQALGHFSDGTVVDLTSQALWSTPLGGLTVEVPGLARAVATGPSRLCATVQGVEASADILVTAATATGLRLGAAGDLSALPRGVVVGLTALADFSDGTMLDVTADTTWTSDAPAVALVEAGAVRGTGLGATRLQGRSHGQVAFLPVTVTAAEIYGLALSPPEATVAPGGWLQLIAFGYSTDGAVVDLSGAVTWDSLDPLAVLVSSASGQAGRAWGLAAGQQSVITAVLPGTGLSATCLVHVGP